MSESTVKAQQCLRAFVDGNYDESLSLLDQVEEPHKLKDEKHGATLLHWAAAKGWLNIVQQLLDKYEFHPMCKNNYGETPLPVACYNGHLDVVRYLITECKCDPMCKRDDGYTPLDSACYNGHLDVVRYLITECKCDPMCKRDDGSTPLHFACYNGHLDVIQYLITECNCDSMCKRNDGITPLHESCYSGHLNVIMYLAAECKCDPMCKDNDGFTPLDSACYNGHLDVVRYLITECKCDSMCKRNDGSSPLHSACYNGHLDVVQYLIAECKCDPMCKDNDGYTPLHKASYNGHLEVVKYLITECKCDPMCTADNLTPFHLAIQNSHHPVIEYFLSLGSINPETNILFRTTEMLLNGKTFALRKVFSKLKTCFSVDSYVNVILLGNPGAGKSTLAQVIIQTSSGIRLFGRFQKVEGVVLHTAGIVPTRIEHQRLGNIILHDLAGQSEYYSSHIGVLENLLQDCPAVFINFVNLCEEEFLTSLHKWITVIENVSQNVSSPCHVVTVASHVDMITPGAFLCVKEEISAILSSRLDGRNVINVGVVGLDCRKCGGGEFSSFIITLSKSCQAFRSANSIKTSLYCRMLYTFLEKNKTTVIRVDELCQLLADTDVLGNYYIPQEQEDVLETLSSLHSTGLITFLKNNHTPGTSWVIVDKRVLLANVNGVLFAPKTFKQYHDISSNTGEIIRYIGLLYIYQCIYIIYIVLLNVQKSVVVSYEN